MSNYVIAYAKTQTYPHQKRLLTILRKDDHFAELKREAVLDRVASEMTRLDQEVRNAIEVQVIPSLVFG